MTEGVDAERARWYQRAVPMTGLVVAVVAVLALVFPAFRGQVALSATHQTQQYVALSFGRAADGTVAVCGGSSSEVTVRFAVTSHLAERRRLTYVVTVGSTRLAGRAGVDPGDTSAVSRSVRRPAGRFDITVELPQQGERVVAHCPRQPADRVGGRS